jgi:carnitine O-acetyltransferase
MIFQLAYFLTHSSPCGTYEAAQVRKYQLGRTETVRICTSETLAWTQAMVGGASGEEKVRLFREAVAGHGKDMKDASNGMGVDRHLFGTSLSPLSPPDTDGDDGRTEEVDHGRREETTLRRAPR